MFGCGESAKKLRVGRRRQVVVVVVLDVPAAKGTSGYR